MKDPEIPQETRLPKNTRCEFNSKTRISYILTSPRYFVTHRLPLALAAKEEGYDVTVICPSGPDVDEITSHGFKHIHFVFNRKGTNPIFELMTILKLSLILITTKPDLVHNLALKPVLYGTIAARLAGVKGIVNLVAGLGYSFSGNSKKQRIIQFVIKAGLFLTCRSKKVTMVVQNDDDRKVLAHPFCIGTHGVRLIRGSGVNVERFVSQPREPASSHGPRQIVVGLAARMLWDKGIGEFVAAARRLKNQTDAKFILAGPLDPENPVGVSAEQLEAWNQEGAIQWVGEQRNMPDFYGSLDICALPSKYREGVPLSLIEAASCGLSIVATDMPGCRDICRNGLNGFLVPRGDVDSLTANLKKLINDPELRKRMGAASRFLAETEFSQETVIRQTLAIYVTYQKSCQQT